jgi:8-oxo-dGTP pyrophosphatase MutT (NUDIX family)
MKESKKESQKESKGEIRKVQVWIHGKTPEGERKVLVLKTIPSRGGFWQPVTGGVEPLDASLEAAALREATEETGLSFSASARPVGYEFTFQGRFGKVLETVFELEAPGTPALVLDGKEHEAFEWVEPSAALSRLRFEANAQPLELLIRKWKRWEKLR